MTPNEDLPSPDGTVPDGHGASRAKFDLDGRARPAFILKLPQDPTLEPIAAAFERGDFQEVRRLALALLAQGPEPAVAQAARDLYRRTQPDPLLRVFLLTSLALFAFLVAWTYAT